MLGWCKLRTRLHERTELSAAIQATIVKNGARHHSIRIRWWIFLYMFGFALLSYVQRTGVAVASGDLLPALHLTQMQLGWLNAAFTTCYALFQIPGGILGQRLGARWTYVLVGGVGLFATVITPIAPLFLTGTSVFLALLLAQGLLGISQAPIFPVFAAVIRTWFPIKRWAMANGLQTAGMLLGGAVTPVLIVVMMKWWGWQAALLCTAIPVVLVTIGWGWYGRNSPSEHQSVSAEELGELRFEASVPTALTWRRLRHLICSRDVLLLSLSYLSMNFVFYLVSYWSFLYLVQARHFSGIESGVAAMIPWLGAALGASAGGLLSDRLADRMGARWGYRIIPLIALPIVAGMLFATTHLSSAYGAVVALVAVFFAVEINEGAYWAATMSVARDDTAAATGVLNTGGNLGGIICQPVVAYLSGRGDWGEAFAVGSVFAILATIGWLFIRADRCVVMERTV